MHGRALTAPETSSFHEFKAGGHRHDGIQGAEALIFIAIAGDQELIHTILAKVDPTFGCQWHVDRPAIWFCNPELAILPSLIELLEHRGAIPRKTIKLQTSDDRDRSHVCRTRFQVQAHAKRVESNPHRTTVADSQCEVVRPRSFGVDGAVPATLLHSQRLDRPVRIVI